MVQEEAVSTEEPMRFAGSESPTEDCGPNDMKKDPTTTRTSLEEDNPVDDADPTGENDRVAEEVAAVLEGEASSLTHDNTEEVKEAKDAALQAIDEAVDSASDQILSIEGATTTAGQEAALRNVSRKRPLHEDSSIGQGDEKKARTTNAVAEVGEDTTNQEEGDNINNNHVDEVQTILASTVPIHTYNDNDVLSGKCFPHRAI